MPANAQGSPAPNQAEEMENVGARLPGATASPTAPSATTRPSHWRPRAEPLPKRDDLAEVIRVMHRHTVEFVNHRHAPEINVLGVCIASLLFCRCSSPPQGSRPTTELTRTAQIHSTFAASFDAKYAPAALVE
jgi:hypothetical protein